MLEIEYRDVSSIVAYAGNARQHPRKQIDQLKSSILEFGFSNPILVDKAGVVIAGHGRLLAARELALEKVPIIELGSLSAAQGRALRLADNKIALNSGWDVDLLRVELGELMSADVEIDLGVTGFSGGEIDVLLNPKADPDDEVIPAVKAKPLTSLGDVWELGDHRIGCGDGRDTAFLRKVIDTDHPVDCAFLDPPYNVRIQGHANVKSKHAEFAMASGELSDPEFRVFLTDTLGGCVAVSRNGAVHFVCMDWRHLEDLWAVGGEVYGKLLSAASLRTAFLAFSAVMGVSLASVFLVFTGTSVARTFFIAATMFLAMSLWGYTTRQDLSKWATFLLMGVVGVVIASVVNVFLGSTTLQLVVSVVGVFLFAALTAWDMQRAKSDYLAYAGTEHADILPQRRR